MRRACGRASRVLYSLALWVQERAEALDHASVPPKRPRPLRFETASERMMRKLMDAGWAHMRDNVVRDILDPMPRVVWGLDKAKNPDRTGLLIRFPTDSELRDGPRYVPIVIEKKLVIPDA